MFIWGILLALLILNILVVLHEFGHFAVAKFRGVTVFEFGIGIPPRMGSVWTNSKRFNVARLPMIQERLIKKGSIISIAARRENGVLYAQNVVAGRQISPEFAQDDDAEIFIGKVKRSDTVEAVVAVSEWSLNWLPIGGFVRMLGEEAGNQRGSLATKSYFTRFMVIFAGVLINFLSAVPDLYGPPRRATRAIHKRCYRFRRGTRIACYATGNPVWRQDTGDRWSNRTEF